MAITRCYHGTTYDDVESILSKGLLCNSDKVWSVSQDEIYCWGPAYIKSEYSDISDEEADDILLTQAQDYAVQIKLPVAKTGKVAVICFEVDDSELEIDNSCENMQHANCIKRDISPQEIKYVWVSEDLSPLKIFMVHSLIGRDWYNIDKIDEATVKFAKALRNYEFSDNYMWNSNELDWSLHYEK